ncbi:DUF6266 family protein [Soonwooa sp.]|uniref:DUF6266 family protein n=1 Tax=Soonwooa sp. TaxID=1938592 RepID=UPI002896512D|nr:DUF6266 family protein [Soonwooa sp.]
MGKLNNALLSGTSGVVGPVVILKLGDTEIIRKRPKKSNIPPSPKKALTNLRMRSASRFVAGYLSFANTYFGERIGLSSRYNLAIKTILDATRLDYENQTLIKDFSAMAFAIGRLETITLTSLISPSPSKIKIDWHSNPLLSAARDKDQIIILFYCEEEESPHLLWSTTTRADKTITFTILEKYQSKTLHIWLSLCSQDHKSVATSQYLGTISVT